MSTQSNTDRIDKLEFRMEHMEGVMNKQTVTLTNVEKIVSRMDNDAKHWRRVFGYLATAATIAAAVFSMVGCAATDGMGVTVPTVELVSERDIDVDGDGEVDETEIVERVKREISPVIVSTAENVARGVAPGPWGEIAAAGVGLLASILGTVEIRKRRRAKKPQ
ncbi:MAG: hypothetical protein HUU29_00295 [Planctomycetaceae bacterium]|nr:hypothetical protein [Planctomycetaceae bacterium]